MAASRAARLAFIERCRNGGGLTCALLVEEAGLLDAAGRVDAAREAYLAALALDPCDRAALNELGRLLERTGFVDAARSAYRQAVAAHPNDPASHGNLAGLLLDGGDVDEARRHYQIAVELEPHNVPANACLAVIALRSGDVPRAAAHARIGFAANATAWPYRGTGRAVPVLVVHSGLGGNVAFEPFIDDRIYKKWTLVAEFADSDRELPRCALAINAIGDADRCAAALQAARSIFARSGAPAINPPANVLSSARATNAQRLAGIAGVRTPCTLARTRAQLAAHDAGAQLDEAGLRWPLIVRAAGFHTGEHCELVAAPDRLSDALTRMPGDAFFVIEYIDVRSGRDDDAFRKYRVMVVDGELYALHLAIAAHWKVHYFRADMAHRPDHRAEEAAFLADMHATLGSSASAALRAVAERLALDYAGIDFAIDSNGRIVIFEANATMIVPQPDAGAQWDYRREPVARIHAALRAMFARRAGI